MSDKEVKNISASIARRLLNKSKELEVAYQYILLRYANERFLFRLSGTKYFDRLILKGGLLFFIWQAPFPRPTRDMDFLKLGKADRTEIETMIKTICRAKGEDDGLTFNEDSIRITNIREQNRYVGFRVNLLATLGKIRIPIRIDIGVGDVVTPPPVKKSFPALLEMSEPEIMVYPMETSIAEKLQTIVEMGMANSRMKDYFDLYYMLKSFTFDHKRLKKAIAQTFTRRETVFPADLPVGLGKEFANNPQKSEQWQAFLRKNDLQGFGKNLNEITSEIREVVWPLMRELNAEMSNRE